MLHHIRYRPDAEEHLAGLTARQRSFIADMIEKQLRHQPTLETRNRKHMLPNSLANWELRIGDFRVLYNVSDDPEPTVDIQAIALKVGNHYMIGGEEVEL